MGALETQLHAFALIMFGLKDYSLQQKLKCMLKLRKMLNQADNEIADVKPPAEKSR